MIENRTILDASDLDGFEKRNVPYSGFKIELVMIDYNVTATTNSRTVNSANKGTEGNSGYAKNGVTANSKESKVSGNEDNDDVFSDCDGEELGASRSRHAQASAGVRTAVSGNPSNATTGEMGTSSTHGTHVSVKNPEPASNNASKDNTSTGLEVPSLNSIEASDIKAMAADASVFSFGDEEDCESE